MSASERVQARSVGFNNVKIGIALELLTCEIRGRHGSVTTLSGSTAQVKKRVKSDTQHQHAQVL